MTFPDGKTYLKFGARDGERVVADLDDVKRHYRDGPSCQQVEQLRQEAQQLLPGLAVKAVRSDGCVTSHTPGELAPFIDEVLPGEDIITWQHHHYHFIAHLYQ